ncbi:TPA: hypothetical protein ACF5HI_004624 [Salmonella enterica]
MKHGLIAKKYGYTLNVQVLKSARGFYIGTYDENEGPVSRESEEYFKTKDAALDALNKGMWTQRTEA